MTFYIPIAAENKGWKVEFIKNDRPYLLKFTKEDLSFYSSKFVSIELNHQPSQIINDKILNYLILSREGIDIIEVNEIKNGNEDYLYNKFSKKGTLPVIIKPVDGFGGDGVYKCNTYDEFIRKRDLWNNNRYCISTFYKHHMELRCIVFKDKVEIIHPKYNNSKNIIRPSMENSRKITLKEIREIRKKAVEVSKKLNLDFVAVDFLMLDEGNILIETNLNPNLLKYGDTSSKNMRKAVNLYEKMFDYKEKLLRGDM